MKFVGALIVPAFAPLTEWCKQNNYDTSSREAMIQNPEVRKFYRKLIDEYNQQFNHVEQIKKFELLPAEWSVETGELTPKLNFKRKVVLEKYKSYIEKIYS
jgi:long-chain acyl-CoA synthetase